MFSKELQRLLIQVITSWQVIFITVALVLYFFLVFYVARAHHKKRPRSFSATGKGKNAGAQDPESPPTELTDDDDLGLEE